MKVLHINANDLHGGAAKVMMRLVHSQTELGYSCNVLVGEKESESSFTFPFDVLKNRDIEKVGIAKGYVDYDVLGAFLLPENSLVQQADVLHFHNVHGGYFHIYALSILSHIKPVVWSLHDMQSITGHCSYSYDCEKWKSGCGNCPYLDEYPKVYFDRTELNWLEKKDIYAHSNLYIVPVAEWIGKMAREGLLRGHPMEVILNGVDVNTYRPMDKQPLREKYGIPADRIIIGAVANGGTFGQERKGGYYVQMVIDQLVEEGYDVLLVNVGGEKVGYEHEYLYHVGYISTEEEMAEVYNTFDIYLFPSIADTCPLVISEAMACGVPVVTFATGGIPELVQHSETGFVAPFKDIEKLYEYTKILVKDAFLRQSFSKEARTYCVNYFDHRLVTRKYIQVYEKAIRYFKNKKDTVNYFDMECVPNVVKENPEFQRSEQRKGKALLKKIRKRPVVKVISDSNEDIADADIIFVNRNRFEIHDNYFETMLYKDMSTDVLTSKVLLKRKNGNPFFKTISSKVSDEYKIDTSLGGIFYSAAFFKKNKQAIMDGEVVSCSSKEEYSTQLVSIKVNDYLRLKFQEPVYVYGAGMHTVELINESEYLSGKIVGIIDRNPSLIGGKLVDRYNILNVSEIDSTIPILISSASFEDEIYNQLCYTISNRLIKIYN